MSTELSWPRASVFIEPTKTLLEVAMELGTALNVKFEEDSSGVWEEYPAYLAEGVGFKLSLLGVPAVGNDTRDPEDRHQNYQFLVTAMEGTAQLEGCRVVNLSDYFVKVISLTTTLKAWAS